MTWPRSLPGICVVLLVAVIASGPAAATVQQDTVTITVTIVDGDGQSVGGGVDVTATWGGGSVDETTTSNGQVLLDVPSGENVSIRIDDDRYARNIPYTVTGAETQSIDVPVAEAGTATVTVRNTANETVENARVLLYRNGQFVTDQQTGADGTVTTPAIEQGSYRLTILKSGYYNTQSRITVERQTSINRNIEQGEVLLTVSVADDYFEPPEALEASVEIPGVGTLQTGSDGDTTTTVPVNTRYDITVTADGYEPLQRTVSVDESDTTTAVSLDRAGEITLTAQTRVVIGQRVRITATDESGDPVAGATVTRDGQEVGTTNDDGSIRVTPETAGTVTYTIDDGATTAAVSIEVFDPDATPPATDSSSTDGVAEGTASSGDPPVAGGGSTASDDTVWPAVLAGGVLTGGILVGVAVKRRRDASDSGPGALDDDTGEAQGATVERSGTSSDDESSDQETDQATAPAESGPATPAAQFAQDCGAVRAASTVDTSGPIHVYDAVRADDGESARVLALAHTDDSAADAFTEGVDQWASISHNSHIVTVQETGTDPCPWAMVASDGTPLPDAVAELDRAERLKVLEDIIEGLYTADLYNISHGAINPAVVEVDTQPEPTALVSDWGLERAVGTALGHDAVSAYTAPEQLDGRTAPTTDVYRVGLLAYWLLTDRAPYEAAADAGTAIRTGDLTPPSELAALPAELDSVLLRATATDPTERYESPSALRDAIRAVFS